jgi:hypothetical protein
MSTEFVLFRTAGTNEPEPILINPAHVRTVRQSGSAQVTLVMDDGEGGGYQNVEGDLKSPVRFRVSVVVTALVLTGCNANQAINPSSQPPSQVFAGHYVDYNPYDPISYAQNNTGRGSGSGGGGR